MGRPFALSPRPGRYAWLRSAGRLGTPGHGDLATFIRRLVAHLRRWAVAWLLVAIAAGWLNAHYAIGLNASSSLPYHLFLIHRGELPQRGQYVAFRWAGGGAYPAGVTFVKQVAGVPGDEVRREGREFFVNEVHVGHAKAASRRGVSLEAGPTGTLPEGRYYVRAPHPDSLDSRYALTGWVSREQIIGRADALF